MTAPADSSLPLKGAVLIEASAGTGKTYTIESLYLRLLREKRLNVDQILVVTYTRAATADLRGRIRGRLSAELAELSASPDADGRGGDDAAALRLALAGFDEAAIYTIHGFCQRMLEEYAFESGVPMDAELVGDDAPLRDEIARDYWTNRLCAAPEVVVRHAQANLGLAGLERLVRQALLDPRMPLRPAPPSQGAGAPGALAGAVDAWRAARGVVADLWRARGDEIVDILCRGDSLRRNVYQEKSLRGSRRRWMDRAVEVEDACFGAGDFEYFTNAKLQNSVKKGQSPPTHPFFDACDALAAANAVLIEALEGDLLRLQFEAVDYARREAERRRREAGTQSYDDLLQRLHAALQGPNGEALAAQIRARFRAALIDEFQDTDAVQYDIFRTLFGGRDDTALVMIGDPKQAIYGFRGADVFAYLEARADAGGQVRTLETNHRSDRRLVGAVNSLFSRPLLPFAVEAIGFEPVKAKPDAGDALAGSLAGAAPLQLLYYGGSARQADAEAADRVNKGDANAALPDAIAAEIASLLGSGALLAVGDGARPVMPADIAVLCRTNAQAVATQSALSRLAIPSVLRSDSSVFAAEEAEEMARLLAAMLDPRDENAARSALATIALGVDAAGLAKMAGDERLWSDCAAKFEQANRLWVSEGFAAAFRHMLSAFGVHARVLALNDGERRMTNLLHLAELLQSRANSAALGPAALRDWFASARWDAAARGEIGEEDAQVRLESDARAVRVLTIHGSKGLEYPVVFCPYLWDGRKTSVAKKGALVRFHDAANANRRTLAIGSEEVEKQLARVNNEELSESLRLLYVALTRARHLCFVVWGPINECERSALGYLLHSPAAGAATSAQDLLAAVEQHIAALDPEGMRAELQAIAASSHGTIDVRDLLDTPPRRPPNAEPESTPALSCRRLRRVLRPRWRVGSYSALIAEPSFAAAEEGADLDAGAAAAVLAPPPAEAAEMVPLHTFPAGTRAGQLIHGILEGLDFQAPATAVDAAVRAALPRFGFEERWSESLARALGNMLDAPLRPGMRLRDVEPGRRLNELEFIFPVGGGDGASPLTGERLARVFARGKPARVPPEYVRRLKGLGFAPLAGFLRGFVDLVFEHQGRWFVVDYKSNHLGPHPGDYAIGRLTECMQEHHYFLQYHLYVVALHRYLGRRLPAYRYAEHFGGVMYLFVRGMSPSWPPGNGIFADRPPEALVEDLSKTLGAVGGEEGRE